MYAQTNQLLLPSAGDGRAVMERGSAPHRIRQNMQSNVTKTFLDLMREYQDVQTNYKNKYRERMGRQYRIGKRRAEYGMNLSISLSIYPS